MGPLRRGLILALLPGKAWAEVCDKIRPDWDGLQVTMIGEVIAQLTNPFVLLPLLVTVFLASRTSLLALSAAMVTIAAFGVIYAEPNPMNDVQWAARREGCIGDATLWYALIVSLGVFTAVRFGSQAWKNLR